MSYALVEPAPDAPASRAPLTERSNQMANKRANAPEPSTGAGLPVKRIRAEPVARANSDAEDSLRRQGSNGTTTFACFSVGRGSTANTGSDAAKAPAIPASLTTFADLAMTTTQGPSQDEAAMNARKSSLLSLRLSGAPMRGTQPAGPAAAAPGPRAHIAPEPLPSLTAPHCLPYDWGLKSSARFTCNRRFVAYDASAIASAKHVLNAGMNCQRHHWHALPVQERWHLSLASWRYPHDTLDTATVAALQRAAPQLIEQRLQGWRHAFTAAYMAVRHGQACAVYLDTPPGARQPCTVLFCAAGTRGCPVPHALVSTSSQHLRARLTAAGIAYHMPLAPHYAAARAHTADGAATAADPAHDSDEIRLPAPAAGAGVAAPRDFSLQSLLLFQGPLAVHLLFDWMFQEGGLGGQQGVEAMDVPVILAPKSFPGATLWKPHVKSTMASLPQAAPPSAAPGPSHRPPHTDHHVLELSGPLPPWVLCRVSAVLGEAASEGRHTFTAELNTPSHNLALNVWDAEVVKSAGGKGKAGTSGVSVTCVSHEAGGWEVAPGEREAVCAAPAALHKRVVLRAVAEPLSGPTSAGHDQIPVQYQVKLSG